MLGSVGRAAPTPVTLALPGAAVPPCSARSPRRSSSSTRRRSTPTGSGPSARSPAGTPGRPGSRLVHRVGGIALACASAPAERAVARRRRRPRRSGQSVDPHPGARHRRITLLAGARHRRVRPDRVRRARGAARGPRVHRARLPLAAARVRAGRGRRCCCWPTSSVASSSRPGELQVGIVLALVGAPVLRLRSCAAARWSRSDGRSLTVHRRRATTGRPRAARRAALGVWRPRRCFVLGLGGLASSLLRVALNIGRGDSRSPCRTCCASCSAAATAASGSSSSTCGCRGRSPARWSARRSAASGAITQAIARNPLASPDIIGFTTGASAAAVFVIVARRRVRRRRRPPRRGRPADRRARRRPALGTVDLRAGLAQGVQGYRLVLVGIGINAMLLARSSTGCWWSPGHRRRPCLHLAQRQPQRPRLGACASPSGWRCWCSCRRRWSSRTSSARCSSPTTPPAASASASTGRALGAPAGRRRAVLRWPPRRPGRWRSSRSWRRRSRTRRRHGPTADHGVAGVRGGADRRADLLARTASAPSSAVGIVTAVLGAPYLLYPPRPRPRKARVRPNGA